MSEMYDFTQATAAQFLKYAGYQNWMHIATNKLIYLAERAAKHYPSLYAPWRAALRLGVIPEATHVLNVFAPYYEVADAYTSSL